MIERETISAHEINKYDYCPYQWYYERLYGRAELRRLYTQRNARLHLEDSMSANFRKGEAIIREAIFCCVCGACSGGLRFCCLRQLLSADMYG